MLHLLNKKIIGLILPLVLFIVHYAAPQQFPEPKGYVSDYADILPQDSKEKLEAFANELETKSGAEIAVVTIPTIAPYEIEDYAVRLFEKWGIGKKGKDNGVLVIMAVNDRKVRIEVGYGLEGALPDATAKGIIEEKMIPYFKQGKYPDGIMAGSLAVIGIIAKEDGVEITGLSEFKEAKPTFAESLINLIIILVFLYIFISLRLGLFGWFLLTRNGRRKGGYWYGSGYGGNSGGFGGGFGGFGGGSSGGGGASGGW